MMIDNRKNVLIVFLYLRKAFDTVDHSFLIMILRLYSFSDSRSSLISNYLDGRPYIGFRWKGYQLWCPSRFYTWSFALRIIHQWFLLFKNSIKTGNLSKWYNRLLSKWLYLIYEAILSEDLDKICSWFENMRLSINWKKTNGMLFSRLSTNMVSSNFDLQIRGNRITFVETFKL